MAAHSSLNYWKVSVLRPDPDPWNLCLLALGSLRSRDPHFSWSALEGLKYPQTEGPPLPLQVSKEGEGACVQQEAGGREPGAAWAAGAWSLPLQTEVWGVGLHGRIASKTPPGPTHSKGQTLGTWMYPSMVQAGRPLRLALGVTGSPAPSPLPCHLSFPTLSWRGGVEG